MRTLIVVSDAIKYVLEKVAFTSGWLLVVLAAITCIDVLSRKFGIPIPLTKMQELEWHAHTAVFSLWMGYNCTINAHPRVDSYTETLKFRTKAWVEFWGCIIFALPFMYVNLRHGYDFFWSSLLSGENSENSSGLSHRWIIKGVFYVGLWLLFLGLLSVWLRLIVFLFGGVSKEEGRLEIGHAELDV
jgi:TRAP-type mannitol/chloroaromatic compound transport system permease small subunit